MSYSKVLVTGLKIGYGETRFIQPIIGGHMADDTVLEPTEDLDDTDDSDEETDGTDDELQSGDDLAAQALEEAGQAPARVAPAKAMNSAALGETLQALQNVIERNADELDRIKEEMGVQRQALKNVFENDSQLSEATTEAATVTAKVKERKSQIQNSPEILQYKTKIGELSEQKKEIEEALNNHLLNLFQITGTKTFDTLSGKQREFSVKASLKGRKPERE
ncbi:hypothetical protein BH10PAT2_BH10PAT2_3460 [soil metagenome]